MTRAAPGPYRERVVKTPASQLEAWSVSWSGAGVDAKGGGVGMGGVVETRVGLLDAPERISWWSFWGRGLAIAWSFGMALLGLAMLMGRGPGVFPLEHSPAAWLLGVAGIAGGWFVFLVLVADAWFRTRRVWWRWSLRCWLLVSSSAP